MWAARDGGDAAAVLAGYPGPLWVVGGRAIEAFTEVTRPDEDIDIALAHEGEVKVGVRVRKGWWRA